MFDYLGTRLEIIRLATVIKKCRTYYFDTILAYAEQIFWKPWAILLRNPISSWRGLN